MVSFLISALAAVGAASSYPGDNVNGVRVWCEVGEYAGPSAPELTVRATINLIVRPDWAPLGAGRFLALVKSGFYNGTAMFRVIPNFLAQFGMSSNRQLQDKWGKLNIVDDVNIGIPVTRGVMAYGGYGKDSRSTQVWIAYKASPGLGAQPWETPFAHVVGEEDMSVVDSFYAGFGEGVKQGNIWSEGYAYVRRGFQGLTYFGGCAVVPKRAAAAAPVRSAARYRSSPIGSAPRLTPTATGP